MKITIDNTEIYAVKGETILNVAAKNDIYIPSLCAHPDLVPYGGCRLCVVEIDGHKDYPTACTTLVEEGMTVRTNTKTLNEMRTELIQLILSEHPAACLLCDDIEGCSVFQGTIRKVGITTGCRWCPNDKDCELQRIVENLDIHDLTLPGLYRDIPIEKFDPFFDRDYNLCIYCGRCVRICNEYRKSSVLSLKQRGKFTTIGPAYENTHIEANCEFCGACVTVCPTGAMSEKSRKWWGAPDNYQSSVCPLCSLNCNLQVLTLKNKIVGTMPLGKPHEAGGNLCVKGRFGLAELVNRAVRILEPEYRFDEGYGIVSWDVVLEKTKEIFQDIEPGRSALLLSPSLSLEEMHTANHVAKEILQTDIISSSCINNNLMTYSRMSANSISLSELKKAKGIVSFFLDGNYKFAPVSLIIKELASNNLPFYQIGWIKDTSTRFAKHQFTYPDEGYEEFIEKIAVSVENNNNDIADLNGLTDLLISNKKCVIVIGPEVMALSNCRYLLDKILRIAQLSNAKIYMPNQFGNLNGLLNLISIKPFSEVQQKIADNKIDLIYLVGDSPYSERPNVDKIIYQNAFPPPENILADVIIPASLWGEAKGSYLNSDGQIKKSKALAEQHGYSRSHEEILRTLAKTFKIKIPKFTSKLIRPVLENETYIKAEMIPVGVRDKNFPYILIQEKSQHTYNSLNLSTGIEGFGELVKINHILINPADAKNQGIKNGDKVIVISNKNEKYFTAEIKKNMTKGTFLLALENGRLEFESNPCPVKIRRENV